MRGASWAPAPAPAPDRPGLRMRTSLIRIQVVPSSSSHRTGSPNLIENRETVRNNDHNHTSFVVFGVRESQKRWGISPDKRGARGEVRVRECERNPPN